MQRVGKWIGSILYKKFERYATWPTWRLIFTSLFFLIIAVFFLRSNNKAALEKYREVIKADQNSGSVYEKLEDLQSFTFHHLNSDLGQPVQLVNTYNRDAQKIFNEAQGRIDAAGGEQNIYLNAQKECESRGIPITARAQCAADYVLENSPSSSQNQLKVNLPDKSLYSFRFTSPRWAWDAAGIFILLSLIFLSGAIFRTLLAYYLRRRWSRWDGRYL